MVEGENRTQNPLLDLFGLFVRFYQAQADFWVHSSIGNQMYSGIIIALNFLG